MKLLVIQKLESDNFTLEEKFSKLSTIVVVAIAAAIE